MLPREPTTNPRLLGDDGKLPVPPPWPPPAMSPIPLPLWSGTDPTIEDVLPADPTKAASSSACKNGSDEELNTSSTLVHCPGPNEETSGQN